MKFAVKLTILFLLGLTLAGSAFAQEPSPREQFQSAVAAYQKSPTRATALKVIELYKQLDPAPAVPEEARRPFVMGATVLKKSNDKAGAAKAVEFFTEAVKTAPWFAEAYYDRALAREITGQFTEAIDDLKLYLSFTLPDTERRDAQDKIYSLEADAQLAATKKADTEVQTAAKKAEEDKIAAQIAQARRFEGRWYRLVWTTRVRNNEQIRQSFTMIRDASNNLRFVGMMASENISPLRIEGGELRFSEVTRYLRPPTARTGDNQAARELLTADGEFFVSGGIESRGSLSADGNRLRITDSLVYPTNRSTAFWEDFWRYNGGRPNSRFGGEPWIRE